MILSCYSEGSHLAGFSPKNTRGKGYPEGVFAMSTENNKALARRVNAEGLSSIYWY